jgi:hypothetical protein
MCRLVKVFAPELAAVTPRVARTSVTVVKARTVVRRVTRRRADEKTAENDEGGCGGIVVSRRDGSPLDLLLPRSLSDFTRS